jgi:restriction system protein
MMPKERAIQVPLLMCLEEMGGEGKPREIYPRMRKFFPDLTDSDLAETLAAGGSKWTNRIQWARQRPIARGEMTSPAHGIWAITDKGRKRLAEATGEPAPQKPKERTEDFGAALLTPNLEELAEEYIAAFKQKVLEKLQDLAPQQFERFAASLLAAYGFAEVRVTGRSGDGGIDGRGRLKVGLAAMNVAFQCKRWQGQVGRPEVDKFRGAIQGECEQGIFFTTSDFSPQAREASIKKGAVPIILINGDAIVELMMEKGLGVKRRALQVYEDQIETLFEEGLG